MYWNISTFPQLKCQMLEILRVGGFALVCPSQNLSMLEAIVSQISLCQLWLLFSPPACCDPSHLQSSAVAAPGIIATCRTHQNSSIWDNKLTWRRWTPIRTCLILQEGTQSFHIRYFSKKIMPRSRQHRAENVDKITANTPAKRRREDWKDKNTTSASGSCQRRSASARKSTKASPTHSTKQRCLLASAVTALPQVLRCLESVNCESYAASASCVHKSQSPKQQHGNRYESECIGICSCFHWGELFHWRHLPRQPRANAVQVILSKVHAQIPGSVESGAEEEKPFKKHANRHSQTDLQGLSTLGPPSPFPFGLWNLWNKSALPQKSKQSVSRKRGPMTWIFATTTCSFVPNKFQAEQFAPVGWRDLFILQAQRRTFHSVPSASIGTWLAPCNT